MHGDIRHAYPESRETIFNSTSHRSHCSEYSLNTMGRGCQFLRTEEIVHFKYEITNDPEDYFHKAALRSTP